MSREPLFGRISIQNKIFLTKQSAKYNRPMNEVLEAILDAQRLKRDIQLTVKEDKTTSLDITRKKLAELEEKRKARRGNK